MTEETENIAPFENIILKMLTLDKTFFGKAMPILNKRHFNTVGTQELFGLLSKHYKTYHKIPSIVELVMGVRNIQNSTVRTEVATALSEINKITEINNTEFLCDETVKFVKDALYMEALQIGSDGLMNKDEELKLKAERILDERSRVNIDSDLGLDFDDIDAMIEYYSERNVGIKTQHKEFNKRLGAGFLPGTLSIILASQGIGKSLLMTDLISGIFKKNKNILLVSLEMADKEIMKRVHANALHLPINSLIDLSKTEGELAEIQEERETLTEAVIREKYNSAKVSGECGKLYIKDYAPGTFSAIMLDNLIESFYTEKDIKFDIVFVDYLGIMKSDLISPSAGLYSYIKSIGEEVRAIAKKQNIPIVSASQLNRCISTDTVISGKTAKEINVGDVIDSVHSKVKVIDKSNIVKQRGFLIKTKSGKELICSGEHKIPTNMGIMTPNIGLGKGLKVHTKTLRGDSCI